MFIVNFFTALAAISLASASALYLCDEHDSQIRIKEGIKYSGSTKMDDHKKAKLLTEIFAIQFKNWADNIEKEIEEFKGKTAVKEFGESFDKSIDDLNATIPHKTANVTEYVENVGKTAVKVLEKIKSLAETADDEQNKKFFKKFLESTSGAFKNIVEQIKEGNQQLIY